MTSTTTPFAVELRPSRERLVLAVTGEIDIATGHTLLDAAADAIADGWRNLVVDLRRVGFMDSAAAHGLIELRRLEAGQGIHVEVVHGSPDAMAVLRVLDLEDVLPAVDGRELDLLT